MASPGTNKFSDLKDLEKLKALATKVLNKNKIGSFQYQGVNPIIVLEELKKTPSSSEEDILQMCFLDLSRRTNLKSMKNKMSKEGYDIVHALKQKYKLKRKVKEDPTGINIARVAACFPQVTM